MSLSIINGENKQEEEKVFCELVKLIDDGKSFVFDSGAGAGKTYALIETLKYIVRCYGKQYKSHNQNILCITYTNVATEEVKDRLGSSEVVKVSTIHDRFWDIIRKYQKELVVIHSEKISEELDLIQNKIDTKNEFEKFRELDITKKEKFIETVLTSKELYYSNYNQNAAAFRMVLKDTFSEYNDLMSSISKFKEIVNTIIKQEQLAKCIEFISEGKEGYKVVRYDSRFNRDKLEKMRISHDTLLEYVYKIVDRFDALKRIIIDKYPIILIDEYQDTNEYIVKTMNLLDTYAMGIRHNIIIGYYGDTAQNIYTDGIGKTLTILHEGLFEVLKQFNRRSTIEVIEVINKIRADKIKQVSIFEDCKGGSVEFYEGDRADIHSFIDYYTENWEISRSNKLHCFVLTNRLVAEFSGFSNIYETFSKAKIYKGLNYDKINTELLSNDLKKLGVVPNQLVKIIKLFIDLNKPNTLMSDILGTKSNVHMNLGELKGFVETLKNITGNTLGEYIKSFAHIVAKNEDELLNGYIEYLFEDNKFTYEHFFDFILGELFPNIVENERDNATEVINALMDIKMTMYENWCKYVMNQTDEIIQYHTYHGTKGLEFDNVIVIMENAFGRSSNYFNRYFLNVLKKDELGEMETVKNLLYVACSRAIKNLRILYLDDIEPFKEGVTHIFNEPKKVEVLNK